MMPISRRRALQLASAGVTASVLGGLGLDYRLRQRSNSPFVPATGADLLEPVTLRSCDGRLRVRLEAAEGYVQIAGRPAIALSYNGGVPGPTLRVQAGDRLELELVNRLSQPTNLHTHGLNVSPDGNADNVFVRVEPGASFDYDYQLPPDHPPGVFWYHPHHHGMVADQVFGGLFGSIIIDDPAAAAEIAVTRERLLVISDVSLDSHWRIQRPSPGEVMSGREGELILVNGQSVPRMSARPGDRERWRIVNACVARYVRLRLDSQHIQLLGIDSGRFSSPQDVEQIDLMPGNRADVIVTMARGDAELRALPVDRGSLMGAGGMMGRTTTRSAADRLVANLRVAGPDATPFGPLPAGPAPRDLRDATPSVRRELTLAMAMGMAGRRQFTIDGRGFDSGRIDQIVSVGTVEEWTITNTSTMDHPFHLHVWPMQLVGQNGQPVRSLIQQDVHNVPARSSITVRVAFDRFTGRTAYHCHILDHEDLGMMGVLAAR